MIQFRTIKTQEDLQKAVDLCDENGIQITSNNEVLFGAFDGDKMVGLSALKKIYQIEPIINVSGHGYVSGVLLEKVIACASLLTNKVFGFVSRKKYLDLYERVGFTILEDATMIEKDV
ncbi:hypothetical protein JW865_09405 [Candidatus Bathyarchaeota archaeon]|nr:hypothetical protein [Candidatus Bathyarchaeota archaeon]